MAGLVLKLRAGERMLVNGAALESSGRAACLRVLTPGADILRMRDAIDPADAATPVGRLTHLVQLVVAGLAPREAALAEAGAHLAALQEVFRCGPDRAALARIADHLAGGRAYPALRLLRELRAREARLLALARGA
ncbi:flagellar biosynthesis repressor FlbT [Jannaschia sp. W003]|uniref:flagellar biosynthesis repressor FlbT n=1 Tax=Jannaschia sp. W003 TaxID=2867012 RepID=UPI0021A29E6B|nr:flagellar biosynthesis repressor FlbT [Jannaschia sp. W003]UWQ21840.1 flagellar biosynthesis repressor FlbT [Jannaschia sp. W003]